MRVSKYNASGNDFVIFHMFVSSDRSELARKLCDRFSGVGADGLIVLLPHENGVKWEFYNNDGSDAAMCGNGSRAALLYAHKNGLTTANTNLLTGAGLVSGSVSGDIVEVELTSPNKVANKFSERGYEWHFYDTGVPHLVAFVDDIELFDAALVREMRFKFNANVNFAKIEADKLLVRTYERGVEAETLACGTGMAACFCAGMEEFNLPKNIVVQPRSGENLQLRLENKKIFFKGKVRHCFDAEFIL